MHGGGERGVLGFAPESTSDLAKNLRAKLSQLGGAGAAARETNSSCSPAVVVTPAEAAWRAANGWCAVTEAAARCSGEDLDWWRWHSRRWWCWWCCWWCCATGGTRVGSGTSAGPRAGGRGESWAKQAAEAEAKSVTGGGKQGAPRASNGAESEGVRLAEPTPLSGFGLPNSQVSIRTFVLVSLRVTFQVSDSRVRSNVDSSDASRTPPRTRSIVTSRENHRHQSQIVPTHHTYKKLTRSYYREDAVVALRRAGASLRDSSPRVLAVARRAARRARDAAAAERVARRARVRRGPKRRRVHAAPRAEAGSRGLTRATPVKFPQDNLDVDDTITFPRTRAQVYVSFFQKKTLCIVTRLDTSSTTRSLSRPTENPQLLRVVVGRGRGGRRPPRISPARARASRGPRPTSASKAVTPAPSA